VTAGARSVARRVLDGERLTAAAAAAFAASFGALAALRHRSFETGRFDLGNMTQAVWSTAHGHALRATSDAGEQFTRLGAHFDPILALFAPLWLLWPSPTMLLVVQAAAVATGAFAVHRLAVKHIGSSRAGTGLALAYLLAPVVGWMTLSDFHPVVLATPLLLWAFWFLDEERLVPFALCAGFAVLTKEHVGLGVAGMGLWYALSRRHLAAGLVVTAAGIAASALAIGVVIPHFSPAGRSAFEGRYEAVGGSPSGIARTLASDPLTVLREATERGDIVYLLQLTLPFAGLFLLAPLTLLAALPELTLNVLSGTPTQTSIHYHYSATAVAALTVGAVLGAGHLRARRGWGEGVATTVAAASLASAVFLGPLPLWNAVPGSDALPADTFRVDRHDRAAARAVARVPGEVVVSASGSLGGHLSARRRILGFPQIGDATWIAVDLRNPGYLDRADRPRHALVARRLLRDPGWRLVFAQDGVLVLRRAA